MRKSILWFVFLTLLTIQSAFAQGFFVKGKVISQEDNEPLIGVSILQEGSTNGVVTDVDGNYSLEIKGTARATLLFSYIGMQSQKHEVSAKTGTLNVRLAPDAALIDEVVVVAYGVRKKGTIAGSVSTVKSEKMENVPAAGSTRHCRDRRRVCQLSPIPESPVKRRYSRFAVPTLSIRVHPRCLFWTVCLFPVRILTQSAREISNLSPC